MSDPGGKAPGQNVRRRRQCEAFKLFGTIKFESECKPKKGRSKR